MVNLIKLQCPSCNANLEVADNVRQCFCTYCGTKILIDNENERVLRLVDEARIKEAEAMQDIANAKLREKELQASIEEKKIREAAKRQRIFSKIFWGFVVSAAAGGLLSALWGFPRGFFPVIIGAVFYFISIPLDEAKRSLTESGLAKFPNSSKPFSEQTYSDLELDLQREGFTNIECINLHDLTSILSTKKNKVESITINDVPPSRGQTYPLNSPIVIKYHGK